MESEADRLFIALALPEPIRAVLATLAKPLPGMVWTPASQLHVTIRFLGDVPRAKMETVLAALSRIQVTRFVLPIEGCGTFPIGAPPRVLWAGVGPGHPRLFQLRQRLDDALLGCGLPLDVRTFHPHVTLARCREEASAVAATWRQAMREFVGPSFEVEAFDLYASELRPSGAVHELLRRFPLAK
jgi:RNA 2',3'-cyclic 3'-phosphodiesterase